MHDALRDYVTQVAASVRRKDPATAALADRLLGPIVRWESSRRVGAGETSPAAETGIPYQTLINLYLRDCAMNHKKLELKWAS